MEIGFDLDKIFIDYPPLVPAALVDRLYKKSWDGVLSYRIPGKLEQLIRILTHYPIFRPPIIKNIEFVKSITRNKTNKYYLLSSRFGFLRRRTEQLVKKYGLDQIFDGMFFNFSSEQPHIFKNKIIKKLKLDRYVDDDLPLLKFLAQNNSKRKFFWLNKKVNKPLQKNLFAITHLSEILK